MFEQGVDRPLAQRFEIHGVAHVTLPNGTDLRRPGVEAPCDARFGVCCVAAQFANNIRGQHSSPSVGLKGRRTGSGGCARSSAPVHQTRPLRNGSRALFLKRQPGPVLYILRHTPSRFWDFQLTRERGG
ncbi:hypothetical protein [Azospirillum palustre]